MPDLVLISLCAIVGTYVLVMGVASLGFRAALRQDSPPTPSEWPPVSVVEPTQDASASAVLSGVEDCEYPSDRLEIISALEQRPGENVAVTEAEAGGTHYPPSSAETQEAHSSQVVESPQRQILLEGPAGGTVEPEWIRSMARYCMAASPVVVGPTIVDHEDLFLPRLEALAHLGRLASTAGISHLGVSTLLDDTNQAVRIDAVTGDETPFTATGRKARSHLTTFNPEPDALIRRPPAGTFKTLLRRSAREFSRMLWAGWGPWIQGTGLWLVHTVLLLCALLAVALPAWRQPVLIAIVVKMGIDVVLALPAAKQYGQRALFRSVVPTELMLLITIPVAGVLSVIGMPHES